MIRAHQFAAITVICCATAHAESGKSLVNTCVLYGVNTGNMWAAVHEKHMTLEQVNDGLDRPLGKQKYYRMMAMQQAVLDNPRYRGATSMTVTAFETAECMRDPSRLLSQYQ